MDEKRAYGTFPPVAAGNVRCRPERPPGPLLSDGPGRAERLKEGAVWCR